MMIIVVGQPVLFARVIDPRIDEHKIGDKRRNFTFQNGGVAPDDVLVLSLGYVVLIDNCLRVEINQILFRRIATKRKYGLDKE